MGRAGGLYRSTRSARMAPRQPLSRFIARLENSHVRPANLPDRVFICGISALPPVYLQALQALGRHIDIHLLFTNPCRHYWGDIQDYGFLARLQSRHRRHLSG